MTTPLAVKIAVFLLATLAIAYISRASLAAPRSHGFTRFFVWEAILALTLQARSARTTVRAATLQARSARTTVRAATLFLAIHGVYLLKRIGKPDAQRDETPMIGFEKTTTLVTVGAYRTVRHPLYSSLLFLAWGVFFKAPSWVGGLLALAATLFLVATARIEEAENVRFFGQIYQDYIKRTRMFIPFLF